jgi:hypothetical protein
MGMSKNKVRRDTPRNWTIGVRPGPNQVVRKVTKIVSLGGNGFSVLTPYHKAQSGYLFKMPVPAGGQGKFSVRLEETTGFTVEGHVKLSYHTDGFAQFSSEKQGEVISGRDPVTGEPKGLGLLTNPLTTPIWTGASVAVTIWGLDDFEEMKESGQGGLVFGEEHCYYRACSPEDANGWILEIYAFPSGVVPPLRWQDGHFMLDVAMEPLNLPLVSVKRLSVIYLPEEEVFLGLALNRMIVSFPSASGWVLNGPGDHRREHDGHVLMACYPRDGMRVGGRSSLNRK